MTRVAGQPRTVSVVNTALGIAAAAIPNDEDSSNITAEITNDLSAGLDIQWQTKSLFYDQARLTAQYVGKAASGQNLLYHHYLYDEAANTWRASSPSTYETDNGHAWLNAYAPETGDYYSHTWGDDDVNWMQFDTETWTHTATQSQLGSLQAPSGAMVWHPNLYGAGDGGLAFWSILRLYTWRKSTDIWIDHGALGSGVDGMQGGAGVYLSAFDSCYMVSHDGNPVGDAAMRIHAGSGGVPASPVYTIVADPPLEVHGGGGATVRGHIVLDPNDATTSILLLEQNGTARVWRSSDVGVTWSLLSGVTHPFNVLIGGGTSCWIPEALPNYGVIWAMASDGPVTGHQNMLWRPPGP